MWCVTINASIKVRWRILVVIFYYLLLLFYYSPLQWRRHRSQLSPPVTCTYMCICISMHLFINVWFLMYPYLDISKYPCICGNASMYRIMPVSVRPCIHVTQHLHMNASMRHASAYSQTDSCTFQHTAPLHTCIQLHITACVCLCLHIYDYICIYLYIYRISAYIVYAWCTCVHLHAPVYTGLNLITCAYLYVPYNYIHVYTCICIYHNQ